LATFTLWSILIRLFIQITNVIFVIYMDQGLGVSQIEPATTNSYMTSVEVWWWHFCHLHLLVIMFCFFHFSYTKRTQIPQIILVYISSFVKKSGAW